MKLKNAIGKRIAVLCAENKLTIHELSIKTGVANSTLVDIINQKYESVQLKHILSICQGLEISFLEFFDAPYLDPNILEIQ